MQIHLIAVGTRMPDWVEQGYAEYARRMPPECRLQLHEISAGKRGKNADIARLTEQEGQRMLAIIPKNTQVIAMMCRVSHGQQKNWRSRCHSGCNRVKILHC